MPYGIWAPGTGRCSVAVHVPSEPPCWRLDVATVTRLNRAGQGYSARRAPLRCPPEGQQTRAEPHYHGRNDQAKRENHVPRPFRDGASTEDGRAAQCDFQRVCSGLLNTAGLTQRDSLQTIAQRQANPGNLYGRARRCV